ncbi:hypothetical protein B0H34DRAFT_663002 [Crassisporium funariophilum]|nr:hypothetical protein B0H34DRAFT_663002 [Crassisporium funariophilum]
MERPGGILEWARDHNCTFGIEKFQLVDATRQSRPDPNNPRQRTPLERPTLTIRGQNIEPQPHAEFLGVLIDQRLDWKAQGAAALAKGADWLIQFGRLARPSGGVFHQHVRRLYLSIAVPRMLYAADIFLAPTKRSDRRPATKSLGSAIMNKLAAVQGRAARMITGGMRSLPRNAMEAHANLLPFHLLVDKIRHNAALRLATLPATHPLHKPVNTAATRPRR